MIQIRRIRSFLWFFFVFIFLLSRGEYLLCDEDLDLFDKKVRDWAIQCRKEIVDVFDELIETGLLSEKDLFDTVYVPVADTNPQKYHTNYDAFFDRKLQEILDRFVAKDPKLVYVVVVDRNGYLPTHNKQFNVSAGDSNDDSIRRDRSKRLFSDITGLAAARNTNPFLLQSYVRDTGEKIFDQSVPLFHKNAHWGAVRFGYRK